MNASFPAGNPGHDNPNPEGTPGPQATSGPQATPGPEANQPPNAGSAHERRARPQTAAEAVRLRHPRDIVTAVPYLLRFHPAPGRIVVLALHAGRVAVTLHLNAPDPEDVPIVWALLATPLAEAGTDHLAVIGYLPADQEPALLAFAAGSPLPPFEVLRVHDGRWWSLTCTNGPACCPPGEPVTPDPTVQAPLVAFTGAPARSRADLAACLHPGPALEVEEVAVLLPLDPLPPAQALFRAVVDAHAERAAGPVPVGPAQAAVLLQALQEVRIRDLCCGWSDDPATQLWSDLLHVTPREHVPPVATLLAVTTYQQGNAALARLAIDHALSIDPGYGLARLMHAVINAHLHPQAVRDTLTTALTEVTAQPDYAALLPPATPAGTGGEQDSGGEGRD